MLDHLTTAANDAIITTGGFAEPVFEAQAVFRALMDGFAMPGRIGMAEGARAPSALSPAQAAIALTLLDNDTPVLFGETPDAALLGWLAFHTGCPVVAHRQQARFAFLGKGHDAGRLQGFAAGTQDYPDRSTTIVLEVDALTGGPALLARGPGIKTETILSPLGLPKDFADLWTENRALFPRGIDLVLTAGTRFLCLPRTLRIAFQEL